MLQRSAGVWLLAVLLALAGCTQQRPAWVATGTRGMVASDSPHASRVGLKVLRDGGNAFDAAAAVSFALAVTRPQSTGLGGGGFLIARLADGRVVVHDFRETAPAAAHAEMYVEAVEQAPDAPRPSRYGHLAVATPGLLAGRVRMIEEFGTRGLAELIQPAIRLAREGFPVDQHYVEVCEKVLKRYREHPALIESCGYVYRVHLREGGLRKVGERLVQPELARLLEALAEHGADFFYHGPFAEALETEMQQHGGLVSAADLAGYRVVTDRQPLVAAYRDYEIISMPPPSSGGICLVEALNILETVDLPAVWQRDPVLARHYQIEAMKHAFADRARWLGDPDFVSVPVGLLTSEVYAHQLARSLAPDRSCDVDACGAVAIPDDAGTSHFCVVDSQGNCVVSTETVNTSFGSLAAVSEWGVVLNNEMDDFSAEPGRPNAYGLLQSRRNAVEPHKRPLSSMTPTIVLRDGVPCLMLGGSGGPRIISSVLNVLLSVTDYGLSLPEAVEHRRPHHQWQPDEVFFDAAPVPETAVGLTARGHQIAEKRRTGIVQAVSVKAGGQKLTGVSDPRKGGAPAGY